MRPCILAEWGTGTTAVRHRLEPERQMEGQHSRVFLKMLSCPQTTKKQLSLRPVSTERGKEQSVCSFDLVFVTCYIWSALGPDRKESAQEHLERPP